MNLDGLTSSTQKENAIIYSSGEAHTHVLFVEQVKLRVLRQLAIKETGR